MRRGSVVAIAAACALAGCGGDEGGDVDRLAIGRAAALTIQQGGLDAQAETTAQVQGKTVRFRSAGREDLRERRADFTVDSAGLGAVLDERLGEREFRARVLKLGPTTYLRSPLLDAELRAVRLRERWLKLDARDPFDVNTPEGRTFVTFAGQRPARLVDWARQASATERVGEESIRGDPATHHRGELRLADVVRRAPAADRTALGREARAVRDAHGADTVPIDVWIDREGLIRRVALGFDMPGGTRGRMTCDVAPRDGRLRPARPAKGVLTLDKLIAFQLGATPADADD